MVKASPALTLVLVQDKAVTSDGSTLEQQVEMDNNTEKSVLLLWQTSQAQGAEQSLV